MANLLVLDGDGNQKYIAKGGTGTNVDPHTDPAPALPSGAATATLQDAANVALGGIGNDTGALVTLLEAPLTVTGPLTDGELRATAVPVSVSTVPLPSGAATSANQTTGNTSLGAAADAEATGDGSIIAVLKRLRTLLGTIASALAGTLTANPSNRTLTTVTGTRSTSGDGSVIIAAPGASLRVVIVNLEVNPSEATVTILLKSGTTVKRTWTLAQNSLYANDFVRGHELRMGTNEAVYLNLSGDSDVNYSFDTFTEAA